MPRKKKEMGFDGNDLKEIKTAPSFQNAERPRDMHLAVRKIVKSITNKRVGCWVHQACAVDAYEPVAASAVVDQQTKGAEGLVWQKCGALDGAAA